MYVRCGPWEFKVGGHDDQATDDAQMLLGPLSDSVEVAHSERSHIGVDSPAQSGPLPGLSTATRAA